MGLEPTVYRLEVCRLIQFGHTDIFAFCGVRTHECLRTAELKSAPLDHSGKNAYFLILMIGTM